MLPDTITMSDCMWKQVTRKPQRTRPGHEKEEEDQHAAAEDAKTSSLQPKLLLVQTK